MTYVFPPRIDAGNATWGDGMTPDDTQDPRTEPGCDDVPPIVRICSNNNAVEFTLTPGHPPHPPSGICLVGDGMSDVASSPPNGDDSLRYERILGISQRLKNDPWLIERIENLLGLMALGANMDRIGAVAVALANRPSLIENAEELIQMGS